MWCPPTPPQEGNDVYVDYSLSFLYDTGSLMDEVQLPAVYVRKEYKRMRTDDDFFMDGRRAMKIRKDDGFTAPRSLFDRPSPAIIKMRKDLKLQRNRGLMRSMPMVNIKQHNPMKPLTEPEGMAEWLIFEDRAILNVVQNLQGLPLNLMVISPGHTPNWDLVAEIVNQSSRTYRSPKQCRWRYEAVIVPREEGKLIDSPKRQKKTKNLLKTAMKNSRSPRTSHLYQHDNNGSFNKLAKMKFDAIKTAMTKKQPQMRKYMNNVPLNKNHAPMLAEYGISAYDFPMSPLDIAHRCYERLIQDRNMAQQKIEQQVKMQTKPPLIGASQLMSEQLSPIHQSQSPIHQVSNQIQVTPMQTTIVVQPGQSGIGGQQHQTTSGQQSMTALIHGSSLQGQRIQTQTINLTPSQGNSQQQQMMKAIVASPGGTHQQTLLTGIIQQINPNQIQPQSNLIQTSSVSVVLTSPPSTVTSVQPQIVSIQPTISTSTPIVTQAGQSIVQTLNQQNAGQIVSVSQLSLGSTSLSQGVAIGGQPQIRQRSVSKEVLFQHRPGSTNPTVISLSGFTGPGLSGLQNATLRLTSNFNQSNLRTAVTSDKQQIIGQTAKRFELVTAGTPFHIYGQPQVRQKLRFLHTGQITTSGASQTTLVPSSSIGQTVQVQSGQKITVATINPSSVSSQQQGGQQIVGQAETVDSPQASPSGSVSVQVAPHQRAQFVKQVATSQALGQGTNQKIVMVKHELPQQYKGGQLQLAQTQLAYAPTGSIQLPGVSSGQQIATLIKTSGASGITTVSNAGQMAMKLSPVRASLAQQQGVRQVAIPQAMTMGLQSQRKAAPKVTRIAQVSRGGLILHQKDEGKFTLQEVKPMGKNPQNQIFLSNPGNVIPVSQATSSRGETLQVRL